MRPFIGVLSSLCLMAPFGFGQEAGGPSRSDEIFGTDEAAKTILQARGFDPLFSGRENADREKAAALYQKAIALQPEAKINAVLANRIAELYGWYGDPAKGIRPNCAVASEWWTRCIEATNRRQILWAQAHMGRGCTKVVDGDPKGAVDDFKAILELDVLGVEWPAWRVKPDTTTKRGKELYDREMIRLRDRAEELQVKAVEKIHYVLVRIDGAATVSTLLRIAKEFEGLPAGGQAGRLAQAVLKQTGSGAFRYGSPVGTTGKGLLDIPGKSPTGDVARVAPVEGAPLKAVAEPAGPPIAAKPKTDSTPARSGKSAGSGPLAETVALILGATALTVLLVFTLRRAFARRSTV